MDSPPDQSPEGADPRRALLPSILLLLLAPGLIGIGAGLCVAGSSLLVEEWALDALASLPGSIPALFSPLALLVTLAVVTWVTRASRPSTAELYIEVFRRPGARLPLRQLPGRVLGAATTVCFGGSQGLESPSALMGASIGQVLGGIRGLRLAEEDRKTLLVAGASAGLAAVFSSPAVGALYGIEVPYRRDVDATRLVPCAVAAGVAYVVRDLLIGARQLVDVRSIPETDVSFIAALLLIGVACGLGARLFAWAEEVLRRVGRRQSGLVRAAAGGAVLALLAWAGHTLTGAWITFGPGYVAASWLDGASVPAWMLGILLVIRASGTLCCVYGGGGGGVFTSLALQGVFIGQIVAQVVDRTDSHMLPLFGAACFLGAGYRIPLACMLFVGEQSGDMSVTVAGMVAIAIGQVLMGERSVSDAKAEQRAG